MIGTEPLVAGLAFGERVHELGDVTARLPHFAGQDHARIQADDVLALLDHRLPPLALDVVLHLHAERPVVPGSPEPAVDLAGREDETAPLAQADDRVHAVIACHDRLHPAGGRRVAGVGQARWVRSPKARPAGRPSTQATDPRDGPSLAGRPGRNTRVAAPGSDSPVTGPRRDPGPHHNPGPHRDPGPTATRASPRRRGLTTTPGLTATRALPRPRAVTGTWDRGSGRRRCSG